MSRKELDSAFPTLAADGYQITSSKSRKYNCISWAAGDVRRKWDCTGLPLAGFYWPPSATVGEELNALVSAFSTLRFELCENASPEAGVEKIALFADEDGLWTHVAKQLLDGRWSSKMGDGEDITHATPMSVAGRIYGEVKLFMKREIPATQPMPGQSEERSGSPKKT